MGGVTFFNRHGLQASKLASAVAEAGPIMVDAQDQFWVYRDGVWRMDAREVRRRVVRLLGDLYRPPHLRAVLDVLAAQCELFEVAPVREFVNLQSGLLRWQGDPDPYEIEWNPECLSTVRIPLEWDPTATCPEFDRFLESSLAEDDIERAWQILGYLLMSGNPLQRMFLLSGSGGNGKGVFLNIIRDMVGRANFSAVPLQEFSDSQFSTAEVFGKLVNICGDIDARYIENTGRIKELAGDDEMKGERKFGQPFYFKFWGKMVFSANEIPAASDSSRGWTRRWEVIRFPYEQKNPDPELSRKLTSRESLQGILVKAVHALRDVMAEREFRSGMSREKAHKELEDKSNKVRRWLDDPDSGVFRSDPDIFNKSTILLKAFREWEEFDSGGKGRSSSQRFHDMCRQAQLVEATKTGGTNGFYGVEVDTDKVFVSERDRRWLNHRKGERRSPPPNVEPKQQTLV